MCCAWGRWCSLVFGPTLVAKFCLPLIPIICRLELGCTAHRSCLGNTVTCYRFRLQLAWNFQNPKDRWATLSWYIFTLRWIKETFTLLFYCNRDSVLHKSHLGHLQYCTVRYLLNTCAAPARLQAHCDGSLSICECVGREFKKSWLNHGLNLNSSDWCCVVQ